MNFLITFTFLDDKTFEVLMHQKDIKRFLTTISKNEVFWDEGGGFWLAFSQIRYFTVKEQKHALDIGKSITSSADGMEQESANDD